MHTTNGSGYYVFTYTDAKSLCTPIACLAPIEMLIGGWHMARVASFAKTTPADLTGMRQGYMSYSQAFSGLSGGDLACSPYFLGVLLSVAHGCVHASVSMVPWLASR